MSSYSTPLEPNGKRQSFRLPEWATISTTGFDENSLPRRELNFDLSNHCCGHAVVGGVYYPFPEALIAVATGHASATNMLRGVILQYVQLEQYPKLLQASFQPLF